MSEETKDICCGCDEEFLETDLQVGPDGHKYCGNCINDSVTCNECGRFSLNSDDYAWIGDYAYCPNCFYNCGDCGTTISEEDTWSFEDDDTIYCESCYKNREKPIEPYTKEEGGNWYYKSRYGAEYGPYGTKEEASEAII